MTPDGYKKHNSPPHPPRSPVVRQRKGIERCLSVSGYAGNILPLPGIALALGSVWTLNPAAVALVIAVIRTALEDRTLQEELPGYLEYARRVRSRLVPGIY